MATELCLKVYYATVESAVDFAFQNQQCSQLNTHAYAFQYEFDFN